MYPPHVIVPWKVWREKFVVALVGMLSEKLGSSSIWGQNWHAWGKKAWGKLKTQEVTTSSYECSHAYDPIAIMPCIGGVTAAIDPTLKFQTSELWVHVPLYQV